MPHKRKYTKIVRDHKENEIMWAAIADADIPYDAKRAYQLRISLSNKIYDHIFTCIAADPMAALNKYFWHTAQMHVMVSRVESIESFHVHKDHHEKTHLTELYPMGKYPKSASGSE